MGSLGQTVSWEERVSKKQEACANKIPKAWKIPGDYLDHFQTPLSDHKNNLIEAHAIRKSGILSDREIEITEKYHVASLLAALTDGNMTATEVALAYCKRAAVAHQLVSYSDLGPGTSESD